MFRALVELIHGEICVMLGTVDLRYDTKSGCPVSELFFGSPEGIWGLTSFKKTLRDPAALIGFRCVLTW